MKIPAFIHAAALCTIVSTPAHAYLINFEMLYHISGNPSSKNLATEKNLATDAGANKQVTSKARKPQDWSTLSSLQPVEESLTASFSSWSFPAFTPEWHNAFTSAKNSKGAALPTRLPARNLWDKDVHDNQRNFAATSVQELNFPALVTGKISDNEFWLTDFRMTDFRMTDFRDALDTQRKPGLNITETLWLDKDRDLALADNPVAKPSARVAVSEPSSLGLIALGFSALALSRRRAHRKSA